MFLAFWPIREIETLFVHRKRRTRDNEGNITEKEQEREREQ
jgi:hypothetical protein